MTDKQHNILMVGSNARKSGKTTMICRLLKCYGRKFSIAAVKASLYEERSIFREHYPWVSQEGYLEIGENNPRNMKDSGKYLAAGAVESRFLAAIKDNADRVVQRITGIAGKVDLMIVESNVLRESIKPAVFVMVNNGKKEQKQSAKAVSHYANLIVETGDEIFCHIEHYIDIHNNDTWNLRNPYDII